MKLIYFESFILIFFAELFLTIYSIYSNKGKATKASIFAALNTVLYCLNIDAIIKDNWCILFAALGAFVGTFITVNFFKENEN